MAKYCLPKNLAVQLGKKIRSGEMPLRDLYKMETAERRKLLESFMDPLNAKNTNLLWERKMLQKNKAKAAQAWLAEAVGMKEPVKRDLASRVQRMVADEKFNILDPNDKQKFYGELAGARLGFDVTREQAKKVSDLSKEVQKSYDKYLKNNTEATRLRWGKDLAEMKMYLFEQQPEAVGVGEHFRDVLALHRAVRSSFDASMMGKQAFFQVGTKEYWGNLGTIAKAANKTGHKEIMGDVLTHPRFDLAKRAGLDLPIAAEKVSGKTGEFMGRLNDKIPGVEFSERIYEAFLSKLRMDRFNNLIQKAELNGESIKVGSKAAADIAHVVNAFSGSGTVGRQTDDAMEFLANVFWSPKLFFSHVNKLDPRLYISGKISPTARKEALKRLLTTAGASMSMLQMARMAGAEVSYDPTSSDFGQIKMGDLRIDVTGGVRSYANLLARFATIPLSEVDGLGIENYWGEEVEYGRDTPLDTIFNFATNKLSPAVAEIADAFKDPSLYVKGEFKDSKRDYREWQTWAEMATPLTASAIYEIYQEEPQKTLQVILAELLGFSTNYYESSEDKKSSGFTMPGISTSPKSSTKSSGFKMPGL